MRELDKFTFFLRLCHFTRDFFISFYLIYIVITFKKKKNRITFVFFIKITYLFFLIRKNNICSSDSKALIINASMKTKN